MRRDLRQLRAFLLWQLWLPIAAHELRTVLDFFGVTR